MVDVPIKSPFLIGNTSSNGRFSNVMLVFTGGGYISHPPHREDRCGWNPEKSALLQEMAFWMSRTISVPWSITSLYWG